MNIRYNVSLLLMHWKAVVRDPADDFDVVALCNLLSLYGYELTGCNDITIEVTRIHDKAKFRSSAHTAEQWIAQVKQWEAQPHPNSNSLTEVWSFSRAEKILKDNLVLEDLLRQSTGDKILPESVPTDVVSVRKPL
jgi:hypothetical protein